MTNNQPVDVKVSKIEFDFDQDVSDQREFRMTLATAFRSAVGDFASDCNPEHLAIDLTPGFLTIKTVLMETVAQTNNILVYMKHLWRSRGVVKHGTEELVVWHKGEPWLN